MATTSIRESGSSAASAVLDAILQEISVPMPVLREARARRDRVLSIARNHASVRARYSSGSVAYGTANSPLEDADGGIKIDRRVADMREFGPDAAENLGPSALMNHFADYILERLRAGDYPDATVDVTGKRAVKFSFDTPVEILSSASRSIPTSTSSSASRALTAAVCGSLIANSSAAGTSRIPSTILWS